MVFANNCWVGEWGSFWSSIVQTLWQLNPENTDSLTANSTIDYTAKDVPLSLGGSLRYRDGNPLLANLSQRELHQAQTNLDMYGLWKFDKKTQLRVSIDNVLKRAYATGFEFYEREFITTRIDTQKPYRLARLNFEYGF